MGQNCGESTGAVPGQVVRGLRVLALDKAVDVPVISRLAPVLHLH